MPPAPAGTAGMRRSPVGLADIADWHNLAAAFHRAASASGAVQTSAQFAADLDERARRLRREILAGTVEVGHARAFASATPSRASSMPPVSGSGCCTTPSWPRSARCWTAPWSTTPMPAAPARAPWRRCKRAQQHCRRLALVGQDRYPRLLRQHRSRGADRRCCGASSRIRACCACCGASSMPMQDAPVKGLPIGALTSQQFANFYLGGLDRLLLEALSRARPGALHGRPGLVGR